MRLALNGAAQIAIRLKAAALDGPNGGILWLRLADLGGPAELRAPVRIFPGAILVLEGAHERSRATAIGDEPAPDLRRRFLRCAQGAGPFPGYPLDDCGTHVCTADLLPRYTGLIHSAVKASTPDL